MNPVAAIAHVVAICLGGFGGFWVIDSVSPDLPDGEEPAGVEVPEDVDGGDEASLFQPGPLSTALFQLEEQQGDGIEYAFLTITPSSVLASEVEVEGGVEPSDLSTGEPLRVIEALGRERGAITADHVRQMDLAATRNGLVWLVHLVGNDPKLSPPWQYVVPYGSDDVQAGGPLPEPLVPAD